MSPTHTPLGECRTCRYPMDPGTCPECGAVCPDVRPVPRASRRIWMLAVGLGLLPIPWGFLTGQLAEFLHRRMAAGVVGGAARVDSAGYFIDMAAMASYFIALPLAFIAGALLLIRAVGEPGRRRGGVRVVLSVSLPLGIVSGIIGLLVMVFGVVGW